MKTIIILILSHGRFAEELYNTARMITGEIKDVYYINFLKKMSFEGLCKKVKDFIKKKKKFDILIFTDLFGGSCFNACSEVIKHKNVRVFSGVNLGLLLESFFLRNSHDLEGLAEALCIKKNDTIVYVNKKIK